MSSGREYRQPWKATGCGVMGQVGNGELQVRQSKGRGGKESTKADSEDYKVLVEKTEDWKVPTEIWETFSPIISCIVVVVHPRANPGLTAE